MKLHLTKEMIQCSISCDIWTSNAYESFLGVTCHYLDSSFNMLSLVLSLKYLDEIHSADFIQDQLVACFRDRGLETNVIIVLAEY